MTLDDGRFENGSWLDSIDAAERERLAARLDALRKTMASVRAAASGEEPLFAPRIAAPSAGDEEER